MPLTLLFSSRFNSDSPYEIPADVVTDRELVVEIVNVAGLNRRMAGWMYSSVNSGLGDVEIAESKRIAFGKNRVRFSVHPFPYRLKFYPMYGLKNFDLNVYSGSDRRDPGTQLNANFVARHETLIRGGIIQYRVTAGSSWTNLPGMGAIAQAYYRPGTNALVVRNHSGEIFFCIVGVWTWQTTDLATLRAVVSETNTREIYRVSTPQF